MRRSIRAKLFCVILSVLILNIAIVLLFGGTMLETYYVWSVKNDLISYQSRIERSMTASGESLSYVLNECAVDNITVLIYDYQTNTMLYSTARNKNDQKASGIDAPRWVQQALNENIFSKLEHQDPIVLEEDNGVSDSIYLYSKLQGQVYLFMETPRAFIASTAQIAMKFFVGISLVTLAIGSVIVYFLARHIARPIRKIDQTAQRIAEMDFSEKCEIATGDEIEALAGSVNKMAAQLEQNISLLRRDLEREEQTNTLRKEFIANVSHDLKTPLTLISSYTEALDSGNVAQKEAVHVFQEQCRRMDRMVNQMLTLSQLESGMMKYDMTVFSADELILSVVTSFRLPLQQQEIYIEHQVEPDCIIYGDFNRVQQVLTNLLENAVKYVDERKQIRITAEKNRDCIRVSVYNTHPPLKEQELANVFEMFYRTDPSREHGEKSYGVGLAIVKSIVQAHQGAYGACNKDGGVCFWFQLKSAQLEDDNEL